MYSIVEVKLVEKGGKAPGSTQDAYRQRYVSYQTHVQDIGWQGIKYDGEEAGTSGQSKRLEAINISLSNPLYSGSIEYQTHVSDSLHIFVCMHPVYFLVLFHLFLQV